MAIRPNSITLADRRDAGRKLAESLISLRGQNCVVLALPRGGVPVAAEIAAALDAPLDVLLVRNVGAPRQPSIAVGVVMAGRIPVVVRDRDMMALTGTDESHFNEACRGELAEIERSRRFYCDERPPEILFGRTIIVVDDGLANGNTMRAALRAVRQCRPRLLVMAVPVMPPGAREAFRDDADLIVSLAMPNPFSAIDEFYDRFEPVSDAEVIELLHAQVPAHLLHHQR